MCLGGKQLNIFASFDSFLYSICIVCFLLIVDHSEVLLSISHWSKQAGDCCLECVYSLPFTQYG